MGKISPVSGKYIIHARINIDGVVEKPDVIGAVFGQTEGLLGSDLELRELQRSGRIGRIEVHTEIKSGKVSGLITIPSSLDKAETAIIAAAMEVIERIGPCTAKLQIEKIEDVRISKRTQVIERAKELLKTFMEDVGPDSSEIAEEVNASVRVMEAIEYGPDKLPAGPAVSESEEIIVVEGRADVLNLLKYGFKNAIGMNGSNIPPTVIELAKEKTIILFVDGDRGGDLNLKQATSVAEIDFVARAPDGKEVEELTQKEIHKSLRGKIAPEQALADVSTREAQPNYGSKARLDRPAYQQRDFTRTNDRTERRDDRRNDRTERRDDRRNDRTERRDDRGTDRRERPVFRREEAQEIKVLSDTEKESFSASLDELLGSKGASLLDEGANVLGKVPISELDSTLKSLKGSVHAVAIDGEVDSKLVRSCEDANVRYLVGMKSKADVKSGKVRVLTPSDLS
jgi:DNA primase